MITHKSDPATRATPIDPSDSTSLAQPTRAIYVGGGGNITAIVGGEAVVFTAVLPGTILPIAATRVNATGTTATNLVALW